MWINGLHVFLINTVTVMRLALLFFSICPLIVRTDGYIHNIPCLSEVISLILKKSNLRAKKDKSICQQWLFKLVSLQAMKNIQMQQPPI